MSKYYTVKLHIYAYYLSAFLKSEKIRIHLLLVVIFGWGARLLSISYISKLTAFFATGLHLLLYTKQPKHSLSLGVGNSPADEIASPV